MPLTTPMVVEALIIVILFTGIARFRTPRGARGGNLLAAFALFCALVTVAWTHAIDNLPLVIGAALAGAALGWVIAVRVSMIQIPAMVAFQHGAGGVAVFLVSWVELTTSAISGLSPVAWLSGLVGLALGAATFSGSMVASGKLAGVLRQTPTLLPAHNTQLLALLALLALLGLTASGSGTTDLLPIQLATMIVISILLGVLFSVRIGGADMPVLISFLNATAGLAAAFCGIVIGNRLLIACGATVAASGSILTWVMCRAMNRSMIGVFAGIRPVSDEANAVAALPGSAAPGPLAPATTTDPFARVVAVAREATSVVIVPGYGMALSEAERETVQLGDRLEARGARVRYAIHPVAGRMPGHMHVLLAEAEVDYAKLCEIDDVNGDFADTDLVVVVGACDVVNPAALEARDTPIAGMPILMVQEARCIAVCNLDDRPGYSGVPNPLYRDPKTVLLPGDARENLARLLDALER